MLKPLLREVGIALTLDFLTFLSPPLDPAESGPSLALAHPHPACPTLPHLSSHSTTCYSLQCLLIATLSPRRTASILEFLSGIL